MQPNARSKPGINAEDESKITASKMEVKKIQTPEELIAAKKWMPFLESIPVGTTPWTIEDYRDFVSLRTTASILTNRDGHKHIYSITKNAIDPTQFFITKNWKKKDGNA